MTKTALAEKADVNPRLITQWEDERLQPNENQLQALAKALDTNPDYFSMEWQGGVDPKDISFRAPTKTSRRSLDAACAFAQDGKELGDWINGSYFCPSPDIPKVYDAAPRQAANIVRKAWGLGVSPVANMIRLLEMHGIFVFSAIGSSALQCDAFSFVSDLRPFVFLSINKSPERDRFDAAHELGHLVLHQNRANLESKTREREANDFASAFLMPESGLLAQTPVNPSFDAIKELKAHWGVAASAMCYRLHDLKVYSDWQYHTIFVQLSQAGYRKGEPEGIKQRESSMIMETVVHDLYENPAIKQQIVKDLHTTMKDVSDFAFVRMAILKNSEVHQFRDAELNSNKPNLKLHVNTAMVN